VFGPFYTRKCFTTVLVLFAAVDYVLIFKFSLYAYKAFVNDTDTHR